MITEEPIKRKRGRPRKNVITTSEAPVEVNKRPRGRPRKEVKALADVDVSPVKNKRGRPRKNADTQVSVVKKNYIIVSLEDLEFWAETTNREVFKQLLTTYNKAKKAKAKPEIRWYKDRIEIA